MLGSHLVLVTLYGGFSSKTNRIGDAKYQGNLENDHVSSSFLKPSVELGSWIAQHHEISYEYSLTF